MKRFFTHLIILGSLGLNALAVTPSRPDDEEDPYFLLCGQADRAIADGDYDEAAARLIDAISIRPAAPESILLMSNLGMVSATWNATRWLLPRSTRLTAAHRPCAP